jgi:hypothetical protein
MRLAAGGPKTRPRDRVLPPTRYRHPGDVIRLIAAASVLIVAAVTAALLPALLRPSAAAITAVGPAVSAVLVYRLATYWLPVLPGWLSWRSLQHGEYV